MRKIASLVTVTAVLLAGLVGLAPTAAGAGAKGVMSCSAPGSVVQGDPLTVTWSVSGVPDPTYWFADMEIQDPSGADVGSIRQFGYPAVGIFSGDQTITADKVGTYHIYCFGPSVEPPVDVYVNVTPRPLPTLSACTLGFSGTTGTATWSTTNGSPDSISFIGPQGAQSLPGSATSTSFDMSAQGNGRKTYWVEGLVAGTSTGRTACDGDYTGPLAPPTVTLGQIKTNNTKRQQWLDISWSAPAIGWRSPNLAGYDATLSFATGIWVPCGWSGNFIAVGQGIPESAPVSVTTPCSPATASLTLTPLDSTTVQGEFTVTPDFSVVNDLKYWTLIDGRPGPFVDLAWSPTDKRVTFVISKLPPGKTVKVLSMVGFFEAPLVLDPSASIDTPAAATAQLTYNPGTTGAYSKSAFIGAPVALTPSITPAGKATTGYSLSGALPPGLTLNPTTGVISGTPTAAWTGKSTITAALADGSKASQAITFTVTAPPAGSGLAYQDVTVRSGDAFAVAPTSRPGGQTFVVSTAPAATFAVSAAGVVSGTGPAVAASTAYRVTVTASNPTDTATFTVTVNPPPGVAPSGTVAPTATGSGTGASGGSTGGGGASSGSTGSGLSASPCLAPDGQIYADLAGSVGSTLTMAPNLTDLRPATGFSVVGGSLPQGVWLDSQAGVVSGTPLRSNGGRGPVTIQTSFVDGSIRQTTINIAVDDPHHAINYPNRTIGSVGEELVVSPLDVHTHGKRTYRIVCGSLLPGLKFDDSIGEISGTPTAIVERPVPLRVRMTDDYGWVDSSFLIVVNQGVTPWVRYPDYAQLDVRSATIIDPTRSGLPGTTTYSISGRLPRGLTFDKVTGAIYGSPQAVNVKAFHPTVRARNKAGAVVASTQLSIAVTKSAVPMKVTARGASRHLKGGITTLVARVQHPAYAALSAKVTCGSCTHTFNKKTGRLVVRATAKTSTVKVMIVARPRGAEARREYTAHTWTRTWKGPGG